MTNNIPKHCILLVPDFVCISIFSNFDHSSLSGSHPWQNGAIDTQCEAAGWAVVMQLYYIERACCREVKRDMSHGKTEMKNKERFI